MVGRTVAQNPDLDELPTKRITWHSLRVSFATLLFSERGRYPQRERADAPSHADGHGAGIPPVPVEDLRQACLAAHPRA